MEKLGKILTLPHPWAMKLKQNKCIGRQISLSPACLSEQSFQQNFFLKGSLGRGEEDMKEKEI